MNTVSVEKVEAGYAFLKAYTEKVGSLSEEAWQFMRTHGTPILHKKKTFLVREGEHPERTGLIIDGAAKSYYTSPIDGRQVVTRFFVSPEICGPENFRQDQPSQETIEFVQDSWTIVSSLESIITMYNTFPDFFRMYADLLELHVREQRKRLADLQIRTVKQRLEKLMATTPHYFKYFSVADVASYLGIERETLTRLRSKFYKQ